MKLVNIHNNDRIVYLFERLDNGDLNIITDDTYFPYYFELDPEGEFLSYDGKKLKKIITQSPYDIKKQASPLAYSSDIPYIKNYITDKIPTFDDIKIKVCMYDIENLCEKVPDVEQADDPISCITLYDSHKQDYTQFFLGQYLIAVGGTLDKYTKAQLKTAECNMLNDFISYMQERKFDIFCVDKDSRVATKYGYEKISNLKVGDSILSYKDKEFKESKIVRYQNTHNNSFSIKTNFAELKCSENHIHPVLQWRVQANDHFKEKITRELSVDDYFLMPINYLSLSDTKDDFFWLLGYYFGDGTKGKTKRFEVKDSSEAMISIVADVANRLFNFKCSIKKYGNYFYAYSNDKKAYEVVNRFKNIYSNLIEYLNLNATVEQRNSFFGGLYDAEGNSFSGGSSPSVGNTNEDVVRYFHDYLWGIGIINKFSVEDNSNKVHYSSGGNLKNFYKITVSNCDNIKLLDFRHPNKKLFLDYPDTRGVRKDTIPIANHLVRIFKLWDLPIDKALYSTNNTIPRSKTVAILNRLLSLCEGDNYKSSIVNNLLSFISKFHFSKIESITNIGLNNNVEITLSPTPYFIANNIFTHNCGWNSTYYDYPYIYRRVKKLLGIDFARAISPINQNRFGEEGVSYPAGVSILDYMCLFMKVKDKEQAYKLDWILTKYTGSGKKNKKVDFSILSDTIKSRNMEDVVGLVKIEEITQLFPYYDEVRKLCKCLWEDLPMKLKKEQGRLMKISNNSKLIEMLLIQESKDRKVVLPSKNGDAEHEEYEGAFRECYETGVFNNIGKYDLGCYDDKTEILTENGWKKYNEIMLGENLASFNTFSNRVEFQPCLHINIKEVTDIDMYHFKSSRSDQLLTWNHRVLYKQTTSSYRGKENDPTSWHTQFAKDVPLHHSIFPLGAEIDRIEDYPMSDELIKIHAWIITEGCPIKRRDGSYRGYCIYQTHKNKNFCDDIDNSFNLLGWEYNRQERLREDKNPNIECCWVIRSKYMQHIKLEDNYKVVPLWMLKSFSLRQLKLLHKYLMMGDGNKSSATYNAVDLLARDRFQHLCALIGLAGNRNIENDRKEVYCDEINYTSFQQGKKLIKYSGVVWCPTVANGYVVVRRNLKTFISGNSAYPFAMIDFCLDTTNIVDAPTNNSININGINFIQDKNALVPSIVSKVIKLKYDISKERKLAKNSGDIVKTSQLDMKYSAIKRIVNSAYGAMANRYFRLYDSRVASTTTYLVRDLLHYIHEELEKSNNKIVYIDTDALFIKDGTDLLNYLNSLIQAWGFDRYGHENVSVRFEYDGVYTKLLLIALCRYKGFIKKGDKIEEDITGIEAKRADSSKFMGEFQNKLLDIIMDGTPRNDVVLWIESQKQYIKTLPLTDIAFPCKMNNEASSYKSVPIFVRAAENSKTLFNYYPETGTPFLYVPVKLKLKDKNNKYMDVLAFDEDNLEFINSDVIDWDSVIEKNITNKITKIFESMKWELPNGFSNYVDLF